MQKRPALFLDRDGVINTDYGYVQREADFHFIEGIVDLCAAARKCGLLIVIVTNQSGIGRGYFSEQQMESLHTWMRERFAEKGVRIDAIYHCPFHPEAQIEEFRQDSFSRKPNPGMLLQAAADMELDLANSILIGDKITDIEAGVRAGVGKLFLFDLSSSAQLIPTPFGFQSGSLRAITDFVSHLSGAQDTTR